MKYLSNILLVLFSIILMLEVIFYIRNIVSIEVLLLQIIAFFCFLGLYVVNLHKDRNSP